MASVSQVLAKSGYERVLLGSIISKYLESASQQKLEFLKSKYKLEDKQLNQIVEVDPTDNGEYLDWVASQVKKNNLRLPEDTQILKPALELFRTIKRKRVFKDNKDINSYKTPGNLYAVLKTYETRSDESSDVTKRLEQAGSGYKEVARGEDYVWYEVTTPEAACALGSGTSWCTVPSAETAQKYLSGGPLYILYKQGKPAAQVNFDSEQFMDADDRPLRVSLGPYKVVRFITELKLLASKIKGDFSELLRGRDLDEAALADISQRPALAFDYAVRVLKGPWPEGEAAIAKDPDTAYAYALDVLKGPFPQGEFIISLHAKTSFMYAAYVLRGPFPAGEYAIAQDAMYSSYYAEEVLSGRFSEGESAIATDEQYALQYARSILGGRFPEGEAAIASNASTAYNYAATVLKGPFPQGELAISRDTKLAYTYAGTVLRGRFPEGEPAIARNALYAFRYALLILKGRFPEAESLILDSPYKNNYLDLLDKSELNK